MRAVPTASLQSVLSWSPRAAGLRVRSIFAPERPQRAKLPGGRGGPAPDGLVPEMDVLALALPTT